MNSILNCINRLWLGVVLIGLCAGVLLYLNRPDDDADGGDKPQIAVLTISSRSVMEEFLEGCRDLFLERGYKDGDNIDFLYYNPQGDLPTANAMADDILQRNPKLVITASTPMLQVMANRNQRGTVRHVFGLVTDPFSAIEGLDRQHPTKHPDWLGGYGSFQPVDRLFDMMLALRPDLKRVGTVRNPGEACSEATFRKAKAYCDAKGIDLVDYTVENPGAVLEAVKAVLESDVDAIWIGGDNTVESAMELVVIEAGKKNVPVFSHSPSHLKYGTAISLGADYYEVARITATLAADVLEGKATLKGQKIENKVPELLALNPQRLSSFVTAPSSLFKLERTAQLVMGKDGKIVSRVTRSRPRQTANIHMIAYNYSVPCENAQKGFLAGLTEAGWKEGREYRLERENASGDMATLSLLVDAAVNDKADLIASFTTPALQAVVSRGKETPTVYSFVASGVVAGVGKTAKEHKENITGVDVQSPIEPLLHLIRQNFPGIRKVGFIYTLGSSSSENYVVVFRQAAKQYGFEVVAKACTSSVDVSESFRSVLSSDVDAIVQIPDNNAYAAFDLLLREAAKAKVPFFCNASTYVEKGACLALATDYYACGKQSAGLAIRVLNGEKPGAIPLQKPSRAVLYINKLACRQAGLKLNQVLLKKADKVIE